MKIKFKKESNRVYPKIDRVRKKIQNKMKNNYLLYAVLVLFITGCSQEEAPLETENNDVQQVEIIYEKNTTKGALGNIEHHISIERIEKLSTLHPEMSTIISNLKDLNFLSNSKFSEISEGIEILRYKYESKIEAYKINLSDNKNLFIYHYNGKIVPVITETQSINGETETTLMDPLNDSILAVLNISNSLKETKINKFGFYNPVSVQNLDQSFLNTNLISNLKAVQECDDLAYLDCLNCTAEDCGRSFWCVSLLVVAGPETLVAIGVSCAFDL